MLTREENELMCRVGPGTPMGNLMRQYWMPAILSMELPEPDGAPVRVRLLGENLIAFRETDGTVALVANACPHRGASLFFGRNEENGLRCVYHGWKFDASGACVDMPNEPAESNFKHKIRLTAYPCIERNGLVWAYLGPRETPPALPDFPWNMDPDNVPFMWRNYRICNWMQTLEGDIDTSHINFLHRRMDGEVTTVPGAKWPGINNILLSQQDSSPRLEVIDTAYGCLYTAKRQADGQEYHRIHPFLFPFHTMIGGGIDDNGALTTFNGKAWVPMDDENTLVLEWHYRPGKPWSDEEREQLAHVRSALGFLPATSEPGGRWRFKANIENDYYLDYELQKTKLFCGILSNPVQDHAMQETMGPIYNRSKEHLGTTDAMIIRVRRRLIQAAVALRDHGTLPPGVDAPDLFWIKPVGALLPAGADWVAATETRRRGRAVGA